jgi:tetratricopeptide (TPR) repeat protein
MRKELNLVDAAVHIHNTCQRHDRPFFLMTGAGVSYPPVPLASQIVSQCKTQCLGSTPPEGMDALTEYSWWLQQAFHSPGDRQQYFQSLIENTCVSQANLRLAHLLLSKKIANLILTANFDDFISRSLYLFSAPHIICDHPETIHRIDPESRDLQVVHLHGNFRFYDICNLKEEIGQRSERSSTADSPMADFLDRVLSTRSPLVLGYSGWADDVFMSALNRRLRRELRFNIYWFCHQRSAVDALPPKIVNHPNVYFVVPNEAAPSDRGPKLTRGRREVSAEPTMSATAVLDELVSRLELPAPPLTEDPLKFFADFLRTSLPSFDIDQSHDLYRIDAVIRRIERARTHLPAIESQLEAVRNAVRRSQYGQSLLLGLNLNTEELATEEKLEVIQTLSLATSKQTESDENEVKSYELIIRLGEDLLKELPGKAIVEELLAQAMVNRANKAVQAVEEKLKIYEDVIKRFEHQESAPVRFQVARAMYNQAFSFEEIGERGRSGDLYDGFARCFRNSDSPVLRGWAAWARYNQAQIVGALNGRAAEVDAFERLLSEFRGDTTPDVIDLMVVAWCHLTDLAVSDAKLASIGGDSVTSEANLDKANGLLEQALNLSPADIYALATKAYIQFLRQEPGVKESLTQALASGDQALADALWLSVNEHRIPKDDEFIKLVGESLPPASAITTPFRPVTA